MVLADEKIGGTQWTISEFVGFNDLMLKLRDKKNAKSKVTLMGI